MFPAMFPKEKGLILDKKSSSIYAITWYIGRNVYLENSLPMYIGREHST
jgi:hypothetical protein